MWIKTKLESADGTKYLITQSVKWVWSPTLPVPTVSFNTFSMTSLVCDVLHMFSNTTDEFCLLTQVLC